MKAITRDSLSFRSLFALMAGLVALASVSAAHADSFADHTTTLPTGPEITQADLEAAQKAWGDAVVTIGKTDSDEAATVAEKIARSAYAFELGPIQFKPTLAAEQPFRPDVEGTVSYFVGGNDAYPEDKGFALTPWTNVRFDNHTIKMHGNVAIAMGHYYFTNTSGEETKVEYTKGYVKTDDNQVLIFLQDSSMPYGS